MNLVKCNRFCFSVFSNSYLNTLGQITPAVNRIKRVNAQGNGCQRCFCFQERSVSHREAWNSIADKLIQFDSLMVRLKDKRGKGDRARGIANSKIQVLPLRRVEEDPLFQLRSLLYIG